jgi:hypothetical protein
MQINGSGRYELKYILARDQYESLVEALADYMQPDDHGDKFGRYLVTSLYYDTADYKAYWDKMQGHRYRRKLRVRVYGDEAVTADTSCFVEIKQRTNRTIQKRRVVLSYSSAIGLCEAGTGVNRLPDVAQAVIEEVKYLCSTLRLRSACIVSYDRLAFNGTERGPGLRLTFDTNLKCRGHELSLLPTGYAENRFFAPPHWCIMEIKADGSVPLWLTKLIGEYRCTSRNISKYCTALEKCFGALHNQRSKTYQPETGFGLN